MLNPSIITIPLILSLISLYEYVTQATGLASGPSFCNLSQHINCEAVNLSPWSKLFGIPIAAYGLFFYAILIPLSFKARAQKVSASNAVSAPPYREITLTLTVLAASASVALLLISELVIGALCILCIGVYLFNILFLILALKDLAQVKSLKGAAAIFDGVIASITQTARYSFRCIAKALLGEKREALVVGSIIIWATLCALSPKGVHWLILKISDTNSAQSNSYRVAEQLAKWRSVNAVDLPVNVDGSPFGDFAIGEPNAPIQILEFADFECPGCRALYIGMKEVLDKFKGSYRLVFKNYPLDRGCNPRMTFVLHVNACLAASFVRCAGEQGRFWQGVDFAFTTPLLEGSAPQRQGQRVEQRPEPLEPQSFLIAASRELVLDLEGLSECVNSARYRDVILREVSEGDSLGLSSTPSIWVNGKPVERPNPQLLEAIFRDIMKSQG